MGRLLIRRVAQGIVTVLVVSAITFFLVDLAPGGPGVLARMEMTEEARQALIVRLHLHEPAWYRYGRWLGGMLRGDWGRSLADSRPVTELLADRLPNTLRLSATALGLAVALGVPMAITSATRPGSAVRMLFGLISVAGLSVPSFWLAILLILLFSVQLGWLPSSGMGTIGGPPSFVDTLRHTIMPTVVLAASTLPYVMRFTHSAMLDVLKQDFVRTAVAKGVTPGRVHYRHVLANALGPVISILGVLVPRLVGGAIITETIFGWPGIGRLAYDASLGRDYPVILGVTMLVALVVVACSLLVDVAHALADPRIRLEG
ncbi:MAG: ABC transporter permease [Bacillota bacterium]